MIVRRQFRWSVVLASVVLACGATAAQTVPSVPRGTPLLTPKESVMEQWNYAPQRRMGRYRVLAPSSVRPGEKLRLFVFLHGNGNSPDVMLRLAQDLDLGRCIVVCPEAPYVKIAETIEHRSEKYTAMQVSASTPDTLLPEVINLSAQWYLDVIADAKRTLPVDTLQKVTLVGFSQGGFFAHVLLTRSPQLFSTVVSISASMYAAGGVVERYEQVVPYGITLLVAHGTTDEVVPFQVGELIHSQLQRAGVAHTWLPFEGGHWPTAFVLDAMRTLLR